MSGELAFNKKDGNNMTKVSSKSNFYELIKHFKHKLGERLGVQLKRNANIFVFFVLSCADPLVLISILAKNMKM